MFDYIEIPTFTDERGSLSSIEFDSLPFVPKRVFYTYGSDINIDRAEHSHKKTIVGLVCMSGEYLVKCSKGDSESKVLLNLPSECLVIHPGTFHSIQCKSENSILMVIASESYDPNDFE